MSWLNELIEFEQIKFLTLGVLKLQTIDERKEILFCQLFVFILVFPNDHQWSAGLIPVKDCHEKFFHISTSDTLPLVSTTYEWQRDDVRVHTSDIRVTCGWQGENTSHSRWHASTHDLHRNDMKNINLYKAFGASR